MTPPAMQRAVTGRGKRSRLRSFVRGLQLFILFGMSASCGIALALFITLSAKIPDLDRIEPSEATIIYSSDGQILGRIYREDRTNVPLKEIPVNLRNATIAIEDRRFYQHSGLDFYGIMRAIWQNIREKEMAEGASTLTQQLARNVYLSQDKSIQRKVQEAVIAVLIERKFTKDKILELYLNQVFYGSGAFGVQAASRVYFGKDVDKLDLSEAALLAGLPQKPTGYSPHRNLDAALERRDTVLNWMYKEGYITADQRDEAKAEKIHIIPRMAGRNTYKAPHFVDYVTSILRERYGSDGREDLLYRGLRVYTTLNYDMQVAAEKALREGVKRHEKSKRVSEGCFVAIEPENGYIRAMVGSVDPASQLNRCTQAHRQPGSSFKVFVYTAALMAGWSPDRRLPDARVPYGKKADGSLWIPRNYNDKYPNPVTMRRAIADSINIPAIDTAKKIGIKNVIKYANLMGVGLEPDYPIDPYLPSAIGGIKGIRPLDMASAYGTFANDGVYVEPTAIIKVTDNHGQTIEDYAPEGRRVIPSKTNSTMDSMLRDVVLKGTGTNARGVHEARGKTGTTNSDIDAWFIGYVPHKLVAACWVGNDNYTPMRSAYGGAVCAPVWSQFMRTAIPIYDRVRAKRAQAAKPRLTNAPPKIAPRSETASERSHETSNTNEPEQVTEDNSDMVTVTVCDQSGMLATSNCQSTHTEKKLRGTEPRSYCSIHNGGSTGGSNDSDAVSVPRETTQVTVKVCADSGMLAGPNCPSVIRKRVSADSVPTQVCNVHNR